MKNSYSAQAPANLALVKYMGKADFARNLPYNDSLSITLPHLSTKVTLTPLGDDKNNNVQESCWLSHQNFPEFELSEAGQKRFLAHLNYLQQQAGDKQLWQVESGNNFPTSCGIASSASSFAALTLAYAQYIKESGSEVSATELSAWARQGSGSACRSVGGQWVLWPERSEYAHNVTMPWPNLFHAVAIIDDREKAVSSTRAHRKIMASKLLVGRQARARQRVNMLQNLPLTQVGWQQGASIVTSEYQEMHQMFAQTGFEFMNGNTRLLINGIEGIWRECGDGPWVTLDAGPNVHILLRPDQEKIWQKLQQLSGQWIHADERIFHNP